MSFWASEKQSYPNGGQDYVHSVGVATLCVFNEGGVGMAQRDRDLSG